jgi:type I restriction enzyme, S subunit
MSVTDVSLLRWVQVLLGEVAAINPPLSRPAPEDPELVSFVPMAAVEEMSGRLDATAVRRWGDVKKGFTRFEEGDVVMAKITPSMENGKAGLARGLRGGLAAGTTELHVLRPRDGVLPGYILHYLLQEQFRKHARAQMTGTAGQLRVPGSFLEAASFPLAPTDEQERIVDAIDAYLTKLDAGVAGLKRVQANLSRYRASVLKAAVEGRLLPTEAELARQEGRDYEPASVLLKRILVERRCRWEEAELAKMNAKGKPPKDDKWKTNYKEPEKPDTDELPELPEGWCWTTLPMLGELNRGKSKHRPRNDPRLLGGDYPFVQTGDVRLAETWLRRFEATYSEFGVRQSRLWPAGTLCITIAANIAETAILTFDACFPDSVVGFLQTDAVLTRYVELFLRTAKQNLERYAPATAQKNINLDTLSKVAVPLPPLAEQRRMVDELDRCLSVATATASTVRGDALRCVRLRQSILKWAFDGKLVPQDPNDEPASELLARIRARRSTSRGSGKTRRPAAAKGRLDE